MRQVLLAVGFLLAMVIPGLVPSGHAASASPAEAPVISISPDAPARGKRPAITARIVRTREQMPLEPASFTIVAVVTLPNNLTKSTMWKNETFDRGQAKEYAFPPTFDTNLDGTYRVEFNVYSSDMRKRHATSSKTFLVGTAVPAPSVPARVTAPPKKPEPARRPEAERNIFGMGLAGNVFNPAGGGTVMLWPFPGVGLQGSYTVGTFTSTDVRLVAKYHRPGTFSPYAAVGYLNVSVEKDVIGVMTEFKDSGVSGAIGVELPLGRRLVGYAEVGAASITLEEVVTSATQTVKATVEYAPVTIGVGIVYYFF